MAVLGLPPISEQLVSRCKSMLIASLREEIKEDRESFPELAEAFSPQSEWDTFIEVNTGDVCEKYSFERRNNTKGIIWTEPCRWKGQEEPDFALYGRWLLQDIERPLDAIILFYLDDSRIHNQDVTELMWLPHHKPQKLTCRMVQSDNYDTDDGERYPRQHEILIEVPIADEENPPACLQSGVTGRSVLRWYTIGFSEKFLWWNQCTKLLRSNFLLQKLQQTEQYKYALEKTMLCLEELAKMCPHAAARFTPNATTLPFEDKDALELLTYVGYSVTAARRLLRGVRNKNQDEEPWLLLQSTTIELSTEDGRITHQESTVESPLVTDTGKSERQLWHFTVPVTPREAFFNGFTLIKTESWRRDALLEAVVEVLDRWHELKHVIPLLQDIPRWHESM